MNNPMGINIPKMIKAVIEPESSCFWDAVGVGHGVEIVGAVVVGAKVVGEEVVGALVGSAVVVGD